MVDKHTQEHQAMVEEYTQETLVMFVKCIQDIKANYNAYYQRILGQKEAIIDEYAEHMDKLRLDFEGGGVRRFGGTFNSPRVGSGKRAPRW